jgi:hypothetical protein
MLFSCLALYVVMFVAENDVDDDEAYRRVTDMRCCAIVIKRI